MKKRCLRITAIILSVLILMSITACAGGGSNNNIIDADAELNIGFSWMPVTMDAQMAFDTGSINYLNPMVGLLFRLDSDGKLYNELAEGYEVSDDGLTYTIKLRDNIKYSNGDPITAQDFVYSLQRIADPLVGSSAIYVFENICELKNIVAVNEGKLPLTELGVTTIDDRTLVIELEKPCPYFINTLTMVCTAPCSRAFIEKCDDLYATEAKYLLGSGPFYVDDYEPFDTQVHYSPNPYYFDPDSVKIPGISVRYVQSQQQAMMCYESGILDVISLSGSIQELAEGDKCVGEKTSGAITYLGTVPSHNSALQNKNIRLALVNSINRESIVKNITKKGTSVLERFVPEDFCVDSKGNDYVRDADEYKEVCSYNPEKAREYWDQGLKEINAQSLKLSLVCRQSDENMIELIKDDWEKNLPGLSIEARIVPAKQYYGSLQNRDMDIYVYGWGADYPDPNAFLELFTQYSDMNYADFANDDYDQLISASQTEKDQDTRLEMFHEAESILISEGRYIPLYAAGGAWLISDKVENVGFDFTGANLNASRAKKNK